jgi:hypothetical protein
VVIGIQAHVFEVVVLAAGTDAFLGIGGASVAARDGAGPLGTNWFMPALVKSRFGDEGNKLEEGTMVWPFDLKKSRKDWRI